ncbi:PulJ/GspJ family protein [Thiovibrio sp. JS02]
MGRMPARITGQQGITLFELLVAVLLLGMVSTMIYSVLNVGIGFSSKGEERIASMAREQSLLNLLRRQVSCAWYDMRQNRIRISGEENLLRVVTRQPFLNRGAGTVLAVYRYDEVSQTLYYLEKKDYYNIDYGEEYRPDLSEMEPIYSGGGPLFLAWNEEVGAVTARVGEREYLFSPKCLPQLKNITLSMRR